ncbi:hypothetical protein AWJ15_14425 [Lacticaseibacillus rhamnosus]|uniref:hypothetical protein n=1 Tax=Lacticaseibacillus rhamnosus TaxID=47715 RepID=UPI000979B1EE|nr:hypothetical protein [Lacticaseibacillus rhamnosus]AQG74085.1 hypothetical protein AWJ15_14425 [Lacticaseibacillus rhamnosus]
MTRKRIDLTGQRFGRLVAIKDAGYTKNRSRVWECKCDCGNTAFVKAGHLKNGNVKSCGCLLAESYRKNLKKAHKWNQIHDFKEHTSLVSLTQGPHKSNISGVTGVQWDKSRKKWVATLWLKGVRVLYSRFAKKEDAIRARREAEEKYFKPILEKYHRDKE